MYQSKEYKMLRTVANISSGFGWIIVGVIAFIGLLVGMQASGFAAGILSGILFGILFGVPFIVSGQIVSVFLDQKELLEEIAASKKKEQQ